MPTRPEFVITTDARRVQTITCRVCTRSESSTFSVVLDQWRRTHDCDAPAWTADWR